MRRALPLDPPLILLGVAAVAWVVAVPEPLRMPDSEGYLRSSARLFGDEPGVAWRPFGYPAFLHLIGGAQRLVAAQIGVLGLALVGLLRAVQRAGVGVGGRTLLAALLVTPAVMGWSAFLLTEALATALVLLGVLATRRAMDGGWASALLGGVALGCAGAVRPGLVAVGIAAAVSLAWWRSDRSGRVAAVVMAGLVALPAVGAAGWNQGTLGIASPSPLIAINLGTRAGPGLEVLPASAERDALIAARDACGGPPDLCPWPWAALDAVQGDGDRVAAARRLLALHREVLQARPDVWLASAVRALPRFVGPIAGPTRAITGTGRLSAVSQAVIWLALLVLAVRAAVTRDVVREAQPLLLLAATTTCALALVSVTFDAGWPRFRAPVQPLLLAALVILLPKSMRGAGYTPPAGSP